MKYEFIGWCHKDNHDKVWVLVTLQEPKHDFTTSQWVTGKWLAVWGRRGKKLQTKVYEGHISSKIDQLMHSKKNKGYANVNESKLAEVYPEFQADLEKTAMWSMLGM